MLPSHKSVRFGDAVHICRVPRLKGSFEIFKMNRKNLESGDQVHDHFNANLKLLESSGFKFSYSLTASLNQIYSSNSLVSYSLSFNRVGAPCAVGWEAHA